MTGPLISVIVPAFNAVSFVAGAIESALAQTWPSLEVIVVDDGSTDGTADELARFRDRVRVLRTTNGGAARARNAGAREAAGAWLAFLDADDEWLPRKLERQMALATGDAGLVSCDRYNEGDLDGLPRVQGELQPLRDGDVFESLLVDGNWITTSGVVLRRDAFERIGGFSEDPALLPAEDWDCWLRIAATRPARACREPLVRYRLHKAGASRNGLRMNRARVRVVQRALASARGRALARVTRRQAWGQTWATNGWDAARQRERLTSAGAYARALAWWPLQRTPYIELARLVLGRS